MVVLVAVNTAADATVVGFVSMRRSLAVDRSSATDGDNGLCASGQGGAGAGGGGE